MDRSSPQARHRGSVGIPGTAQGGDTTRGTSFVPGVGETINIVDSLTAVVVPTSRLARNDACVHQYNTAFPFNKTITPGAAFIFLTIGEVSRHDRARRVFKGRWLVRGRDLGVGVTGKFYRMVLIMTIGKSEPS